VLFNAYGRSLWYPNSSENLKQFVRKYQPTNVHCDFIIKKYLDAIPKISDTAKISFFNGKMVCFVEAVANLEEDISCDKCIASVGLPDNLMLWCTSSDCPVSECDDEKCTHCLPGLCFFKCKPHNEFLAYHDGSKISSFPANKYLGTTYCYSFNNEHVNANRCIDGSCQTKFQYGKPGKNNKIICEHGCSPGSAMCRKLTRVEELKHKYNEISHIFFTILNELHLTESRSRLILFLLFDNDDTLNRNLTITFYNKKIWNILSTHIKIPSLSNYLPQDLIIQNSNKLSASQIFRLLQISDYDNTFKLYLYSLPNCKTFNGNSNLRFIKNNIYDLSYYSSGEYLTLKTDETYKEKNKKLDKIIYNDDFLQEVKKIRTEAYGQLENKISISAILMAYDKYGLFWMPEEYQH